MTGEIRMGVFLTIIMVTANAGLLLMVDGFDDGGAFESLSKSLQLFDSRAVANTNVEGIASVTSLGSPGELPDFFGYVSAITQFSIALVRLVVFLLTGSIQIIFLLDPSASWGLIILAPIAVFQLLYIIFFVTTIAAALRGAFAV